MIETHECVFVEEAEPSGRLILPPCLVCGLTAMDALQQLQEERCVHTDRECCGRHGHHVSPHRRCILR